MKRILAVLLAVMLLVAVVPATSLAAGVVSNATNNVYHVNTQRDPLLLRADHSKDGHILARLPKGTALIQVSSKTVREDKIDWMKVKTTYGLTGWVATKDKSRKLIASNAHANVATKESGLNVRKSAGTKGAILYSIPHGTKGVVVYKVNGNWAYVNYKGKSKGWSSLSYLRWAIW